MSRIVHLFESMSIAFSGLTGLRHMLKPMPMRLHAVPVRLSAPAPVSRIANPPDPTEGSS